MASWFVGHGWIDLVLAVVLLWEEIVIGWLEVPLNPHINGRDWVGICRVIRYKLKLESCRETEFLSVSKRHSSSGLIMCLFLCEKLWPSSWKCRLFIEKLNCRDSPAVSVQDYSSAVFCFFRPLWVLLSNWIFYTWCQMTTDSLYAAVIVSSASAETVASKRNWGLPH